MKTGLHSSKQFRYLSLTLLLINKCPLSIPQTTGGRQTCVILIKGKNMHHGKNELFSYTLSRKHQLIQKQKFSNFPGQQRQLKTTISIRQGLYIILGTNSTFEPTTLDKTLGILTQQLVKMTRRLVQCCHHGFTSFSTQSTLLRGGGTAETGSSTTFPSIYNK